MSTKSPDLIALADELRAHHDAFLDHFSDPILRAQAKNAFQQLCWDNKFEVIECLHKATAPEGQTIEVLMSLKGWCEKEGSRLGAVDGYDYRSGEEYGIRRVTIQIGKVIKGLPSQSSPVVPICWAMAKTEEEANEAAIDRSIGGSSNYRHQAAQPQATDGAIAITQAAGLCSHCNGKGHHLHGTRCNLCNGTGRTSSDGDVEARASAQRHVGTGDPLATATQRSDEVRGNAVGMTPARPHAGPPSEAMQHERGRKDAGVAPGPSEAKADVRCVGCGSTWTREQLLEAKANDPKLLSCCPERNALDIDGWKTRAETFEKQVRELRSQVEGVRAATVESCAKIADAWPGYPTKEPNAYDIKLTDEDKAVIEIREKIAAAIRARKGQG